VSLRGSVRCRAETQKYLCHLNEHDGDVQIEQYLQKVFLLFECEKCLSVFTLVQCKKSEHVSM
jgi:hypothetical protein